MFMKTISNKMEEDEIIVSVCILLLACAVQRLKSKRRRPRYWVRPWIKWRSQHGSHHALMQELCAEDPQGSKNFLRMDSSDFEDFLPKVSPIIQRQDTNMREAISASERLLITLRYLATGDTYQSLEYLYRIPVTTLSKIIPETCSAIYESLKDDYMKVGDMLYFIIEL